MHEDAQQPSERRRKKNKGLLERLGEEPCKALSEMATRA